MATLKEKLKLNGKQGSVSSEEMANLSSKVGRTVPTTPLEGSVIGGNKDQAKMMGTRQSIQSTLSTPGDTNLQTKLRREQVRTDATAGEQQSIDQANTLSNLGSLGSRVQTLTNRMINQGAQGQAAALGLSEEGLAQDAETQGLITQLAQAEPGSQEASDLALQLNQKLGRDQSTILTEEELRANFADTATSVAGQAAANIGDQMLVSDIDLTELGFADTTELASILGVDAAELEGETLQSLQTKVDAKLEEEYGKIDSLEQISNDPARSAAERAQARKDLRAMGAVGVRSVESDIDSLADQIESADTVDYLGEQYEVSELLDDEVISGLAAKFLDDSGMTDDAWKTKFREENSELATWLEDNQEALKDSLAGVDETTREFADIQNSNKALAETSTGEPLPADIAELVIPGYNQLSSQRLQATPLVSILKDKDQIKAQNTLQALKDLNEYSPALVEELSGLTEQELSKLGVASNSESWKTYSKHVDDLNKIKDIEPGDANEFFNKMYGKTTDLKQVNADFNELIQRQRSGMFGDSPMNDFIEELVGPDGKLLPPAQLAEKLRGKMTPASIRQFMADPNKAVSLSDKIAGISGFNKIADSTGLFDKIKTAFSDDGVISNRDIAFMPNLASEDISGILDSSFNIDDNAKATLINKFTNATTIPALKSTLADQKIMTAEDMAGARMTNLDKVVNITAGMASYDKTIKESTGWKRDAAIAAKKSLQREYANTVEKFGNLNDFELAYKMLPPDFPYGPKAKMVIEKKAADNTWGRVANFGYDVTNPARVRLDEKLKQAGIK